MSVPGNAYTVRSASTALVATTAKTLVNIIAAAANQPSIVEIAASADGTSGLLLVELCQSTQAGAGTPGSSPAPVQIRGWPTQTPQTTAGIAYSAEPTVLTPIKDWWMPLPSGPLIIQNPLGREPTGIVTAGAAGKGMCLRLTASVGCNARVYIEFEE